MSHQIKAVREGLPHVVLIGDTMVAVCPTKTTADILSQGLTGSYVAEASRSHLNRILEKLSDRG